MGYWHGGQRGLRVGSFVEPQATTGAKGLCDYSETIPGGHVIRRDRVYVTTDETAALMYAAVHPSGGAYYEVEPEGDLTPDPDCTAPGLSFECLRARVVRVHRVSGYQRRKVMNALFAESA